MSGVDPTAEWLQDHEPILIAGGTQNGKTVAANCIQHLASDRVSLVWNPEPEPFIRGREAVSLKQVARYIDAGVKCIDYRPQSWETSDLRDEHAQLVKLLFAMNDPHQFEQAFLLVSDELHEFAPEGGPETSAHRAVKRGAKRGVKHLGISQDFRLIPNTITSQSDYQIYVGAPPADDRDYLEGRHLPFDELLENEEHQAAVIHGGQVIDRFRVPAKYADF